MAIKATGQISLSSVIDVKATYRYYLLQSSTLTKPSKPTTYPPSSSWDDTEPTYTEGSTNSLYTIDCTVFCDDTFQYSEVSLSSSYEAAKIAYNKAIAAGSVADANSGSIDSLRTTVIEQSSAILKESEKITIELLKSYATTNDLETVRTDLETNFKATAEGFAFNFEQMQTALNELGGEINTQKQYIRLEKGEIHIGEAGNPINSVYTNDALEFRYNDLVVARFTNEMLEVDAIKTKTRIDIDVYWRMQKGAYIEGKGHNFNINWIGG